MQRSNAILITTIYCVGIMMRKRFRTIQSTNIGSSSSQPPTSRIASSSHQATPPIDAVSQAAPSTPIGILSEQPMVPSPSNDDETHGMLKTIVVILFYL